LVRKSLLARYRQLNIWNKIFVWAAIASILGFIGWLISPFMSAEPSTTVTQGSQSSIYQANRDIIINPAPSPSTSEPKSQPSPPQPSSLSNAKKGQSPANSYQPSRHLQRARSLYDQGENEKALMECDAELRVNPNNREAANLRKRIATTIQILKRQ